MKKTIGLLLAVAFLLGGIYLGATWFMGKNIENVIGQQYKMVQSLPYAKMVKREYRRGLFTSEEKVTFEFFGEMMQALAKAQAAHGQQVTTPENFKVTIHTRIHNGPFPGFATLAAATGDSELILPDSTKEKVARVFGNQLPISCHTVFHFNGSFTSTFKSPVTSVTLPPDPQGTIATFLWNGFEAQVDSAPDMQQYTMHGQIPKMEIKENKDTEVLLSDIRFQADQKRIFQDEPLLYSGSQLFSIGQVHVSKPAGPQPPVTLKQLKYRIDTPLDGDYIDVAAKIGIEEMQAANQKFGPTHFDFTFKHLHARTVANMYHSILQVYANPDDMAGHPNEVGARLFTPLLQHAKALLAHKPELIIDRVSFAGQTGETHLTAKFGLPNATVDDLDYPAMLLTKLEAAGDATIPEATLLSMAGGKSGSKTGTAAGQRDRAEQIRAQVTQFKEQGYLTMENQLIKIHAEYNEGQLKLNGKPFPPSTTQTAPNRQPNM